MRSSSITRCNVNVSRPPLAAAKLLRSWGALSFKLSNKNANVAKAQTTKASKLLRPVSPK